MCTEKSPVCLLGAGFTRAVLGDSAPLTNELMDKLHISDFPEIIEEYDRSYPDVEQFLTMLDLKCLHFRQCNDSIAERLDNIREHIVQQIVSQVDISRLRIDDIDQYCWLNKFIDSIPKGSRILTLNYDCVLEQGLWLSKRWSPFGGYPCYDFMRPVNENDSIDGILVLKLHGSCNFKVWRSGQVGLEDIDNHIDPNRFNIEVTEKIFPGICAHINCSQFHSDIPHILVMSYIKPFHTGIMCIWREAISYLSRSEKLIIIGCSLREEDTFLRFALNHFGMKQNAGQFSIDIIDKDEESCRKIEAKVKKLVAHPDKQQITPFPGGLENYLEGR